MAPIPRSLSKMPVYWFDAAINTLDASRWTVFCARLFGRKYTGEDRGHTIIGYEWRGKLYFTDYRRDVNQ